MTAKQYGWILRAALVGVFAYTFGTIGGTVYFGDAPGAAAGWAGLITRSLLGGVAYALIMIIAVYVVVTVRAKLRARRAVSSETSSE
ncbi:hypothetical protein [Nocardia inohanensis]|uniref:hypothetical protein n=1 Tax=Nocardia inohanensis TaxID=209246 RepID=UPI0008344AA6|nr:hypothetical protein [Nocardia inohanensis]